MYFWSWKNRCSRMLARIWARWLTELHSDEDFMWSGIWA